MNGGAVLLVGAGGIGAPCALALAQAGVTAIAVADADRIEPSNLHRQVLFTGRDVGRAKVSAFAERLLDLFPALRVELVKSRITPENAASLVARAAVVIDATDNFATRFLLADACHLARVPVVHAAAIRWRATVLAAVPGGRPCYRCLFEDLPADDAPNCATAGVIGPVCGVAGSLAADRAVRLLAGDTSAAGVITTYDGLRSALRDVAVRPRADCPLCGAAPTISAVEASRYEGPTCALASPPSALPLDEPRGVGSPIGVLRPSRSLSKSPEHTTMHTTTVRIPTPLRTLTGGADEVTATATTVGGIIEELEGRYPGIKDRLLDEKGVRRFINIYVGEEDIRFLDGLATEVKGGDQIAIVPAIAGG